MDLHDWQQMKKKLFVPQGKVQKDKAIMRETDERMAIFSRYGLILNLAAYLLCVAMGYMRIIEPTLTVILTSGILLITLIRAYYLFRFEALYSRAPTQWRNRYFAVTFIGAVWWSVILVSFTSVLGMVAEVPILWFYTIIFFSTTAYAFSPFRLFCQVYQIIALVPAGITAVWIGGLDGYMYAIMMLIFVVLLNLQTYTMSANYWQRLDANLALKQKAKDLEVQQRSTVASIELNNDFLESLGREFRTSLNDILGSLSILRNTTLDKEQQELLRITQQAGSRQLDLVTNVIDFSKISNKQLVLNLHIFSLRNLLEKTIQDYTAEAHQQGVELDYVFDQIPQRVRGDESRIQQVLNAILGRTVQFSESGEVLIDVRLERSDDRNGLLKVIVTDKVNTVTTAVDETTFDACRHIDNTTLDSGLWLSICKGLLECMGGNMGVADTPGLGHSLWMQIPLEIINGQPANLTSNPKLHNKRVLIFDNKASNTDRFVQDFSSWGLMCEVVSVFDNAIARLDDAVITEHPFDLLLINLPGNSAQGLLLTNHLFGDKKLCDLPQIILCSHNDSCLSDYHVLSGIQPHLRLLYRPTISQKLHDAFCELILHTPCRDDGDASSQDEHLLLGRGRTVLLVEDHRVNQMVAESMLKKLGYQVLLAANGREALKQCESATIDLILMDCQMPEMDGFEATKLIRVKESAGPNGKRIPIVAMTAHSAENDEALCLAAGMDDYLVKPVSYTQLAVGLTRWLGA